MPTRIAVVKPLVLCVALACCSLARAQQVPSDEEELALSYGDKPSVSIATGSQQLLARAPAVASVITARDIAAMGATDLDQVLESVAGLHVSVWNAPLNPTYVFRGVYTDYNAQVLMLVNGLPITSAFIGNRGQAWGGMPLENVARIEVIRGPGSALYGADAFSGVINVITKTGADVNGLEYGVRAGSFRTRDAYIQYGANLGQVNAAFYLRSGRTEGAQRTIDKDVQTLLDGLFGTHASRAPGPLNDYRKALDLHTDLAWGDWRLRATYQDRTVGIGTGLADAVDPYGRAPETRTYIDLSYNKLGWLPQWDLSLSAGGYQLRNSPGDPAYQLFPPGAFGNAYPTGVVGDPGHFERHYFLSGTLMSQIGEHHLRFGAGSRIEDMYATAEFKNFNFTVLPGVGPALVPLGQVVDASSNPGLLYIQPHKRTVNFLFAQDEWHFSKDWTLTAGVRYDHYSDFGATTNPRLALVWDARYDLIVKALHGQAFRAPNFTEQYTVNNPVNIGNPHLQPEKIATDELVFNWQAQPNLSWNLNFFHYKMRDIIVTVPNADPSTGKTFQNTGDQTGRGAELEATWDLSRNLRLTGNFSLQHSTDSSTGKDAGRSPHRRWFGRADWQLAPSWQLGVVANRVEDRARQPGDARPPVPDYSTWDFSLKSDKVFGNWEVRANLLNAFDADVREPYLAPGNVPHDIPMPGRAVQLQFVHRL